MTNEEAEEMLKKLSAHFKKPVMPIDRYCGHLRVWESALNDRARTLAKKLFPEKTVGTAFADAVSWHHRFLNRRNEAVDYDDKLAHLSYAVLEAMEVQAVFLRIGKSNLLWRLLYGNESLRTEPCPVHEGKWFTIPGLDECPHGCEGTGWLPNRKEREPVVEQPVRLVSIPVTVEEK